MKKTILIIIISIVSLIVVLLLASLFRSLYVKSTIETKTHNVNDTYNHINIETTIVDINIYKSNDGTNKVTTKENNSFKFDVSVSNGTLFIKEVDNRKFYDRIFSFGEYKVNLYLASDVIESLVINGATGDVKVEKGLVFNTASIQITTGDIEFSSNVLKSMNIKNTTGDVEVEDNNTFCDIEIKTTTGDVDITDVNCSSLKVSLTTGEVDLSSVIVTNDITVNSTTGDISFDGIDGANIYITVTTGDVEGTILTSKFFVAESTTGKINVPHTREGGDCIIKTTTGSIFVKYK